jgi:hypothetical protein
MPVKSEREGSHPGLKVVLFDKTPVMSTYVRHPPFPDAHTYSRLTGIS